jgi:lysophospholipase L1-like esterase
MMGPDALPSIALVLVCGGLGCLAGCSAGSADDPSTTAGESRYLALGDSYTIGESVEAAQRWPVQLVAALRAAGEVVADSEIIARTGWTTDELLTAMDERAPEGPYDVVSLLIGVNNQYRGRHVEEFRSELEELLGRAVGLAGGRPDHVVVVSIPDWGVTPFAAGRDCVQIAREIDAYNAVVHAEAAAAGCRWVDVTPISRRAQADPELVAEDGLHPAGAMYAEWVELILPEALAVLRVNP